MNVVTISREYGAGGGEVATKLAEALGWELLDRELLHRAAEVEHVPDADLERLDEKALSMADHLRLRPPHRQYLHGLRTVVEQAAQRGNVVLVGRGARHLLGEVPGAFHLRLVAPKDWRARRMATLEGWPLDRAVAQCAETDRIRDRFNRYFFGDRVTMPSEYDLVVNTGRMPLDDVVALVAAAAERCQPEAAVRSGSRRVLTLARELGAGERGFAPAVANRLGMRVYDRELLEEQATRLGMQASELEKVDEHAPGVLERLRPGNLSQRYREALERSMRELAAQGDVILVGRGGSCLLRHDAAAFHVRLVAPTGIRVRRVMEYHWVREEVAKKRISESDATRRSFYERCFGADWSSPLQYDLTVNSGRLGVAAVETVVLAAGRHWGRKA